MIEWITDATEGIEEVVDVLTNSAGMIITKITPLLAPMASGFTVLFAFYDGGSKVLTGIVENPQAWATCVGVVLMIALEGINFSTTFNRDRAEKLREKYPDELGKVNADSMVTYSFWLTVALIFGLETAPGIVGAYQGAMDGSDLVFKFGLLILPFFSKIGARIFSLALILDTLEGTKDARRLRRQQAKLDAVELKIKIQTMEKEAAINLEQIKASNEQRLEIEKMKATAKLQPKNVQADVQRDVQKSVQSDTPQSVQSGVLNTNLTSTEQRLNRMMDALLDTGWHGVKPLADQLHVSRTTVYSDLDVLAQRNLIRIIRTEEGKIESVEIVEIETELPTPAYHSNGISH